MPYNTKKIRHAYKSKYDEKHENKIILLMITDAKKWHYLAVNKLSALFRAITSNNNGDSCCIHCLHSCKTEIKLKEHESICKNRDYCYVQMPNEDSKITKCNHGKKYVKVPFIVYAELESFFKKMSTCHNNHGRSSATTINKHTLSVYSYTLFIPFNKK